VKTGITPAETLGCIFMLLWILFWLAAIGGLGYIAWHFLSRVW